MEQVAVYCQGVCCGDATLREDGVRVEMYVSMRDPGDGLYRALLEGDKGSLALGVMEPRDGQMLLRRRPQRSEVEKIGPNRCVRIERVFLFGEKQVWNRTSEPLELFRDRFLRRSLTQCPWAWWRRDQGNLFLAIPVQEDKPFPMESLFCFARVERVNDALCVVYGFDKQEMPLCGGVM